MIGKVLVCSTATIVELRRIHVIDTVESARDRSIDLRDLGEFDAHLA
jgi:hypothetical protein